MAAAPQRPTEGEVGISEFLGPQVPGFFGKFKERWQDFHVYEVAADGVELHLTELITPGAVAAELRQASAERREARAALGPGYQPEPEALEELQGALGEEVATELVQFLQRQRPPNEPREAAQDNEVETEAGAGSGTATGEATSTSRTSSEPPGFLDVDAARVGDGSKEARKKAHQAVLKLLGTVLNTETVEGEGGSRNIRIWLRDAERRAKASFGASQGEDSAGKKDGKGKGKGKKGKGKGKKGKGKAKGADGQAGEDADKSTSQGEFGTLRREGWPKDRPDYLYFRLYKENCDTSEAVASIARCVGRSAKQFTYAGTKDRRAVTVQHICAHRLPADQLRRTVLHRLWDKRLRISDLEYRGQRLRLGMLGGNRFCIALRHVPGAAAKEDSAASAGSSSTVASAFGSVTATGFLNYYGLQRFGTREVRTHRVGAAVVAGRWDEAVRLILGDGSSCSRKRPADTSAEDGPKTKVARLEPENEKPNEAQGEDSAMSRDEDGLGEAENAPREEATTRPRWQQIQDAQQIFLKSGDAQAALDAMPRSQHLERCLLGALARKLAPVEALRKLPHQALALYAHAAQSLVWNAVLSHRLKTSGPRPVVGDLVLDDGQAADLRDDTLDSDMALAEEEDDGEGAAEQEDDWRLPIVRELSTAEEAAAVSLQDVVMPLPGSGVRYPSHLRKAYEDSARDCLGLELQDFHSSSLVPLTGSYRRMAVKPERVEWRVVPVREVSSSPHGVLLESDVARLLAARAGGEPHEEAPQDRPTPQKTEEAAAPAQEVTEGDACVTFSCVLPPSSYLTMFLRELLKQPTDLL